MKFYTRDRGAGDGNGFDELPARIDATVKPGRYEGH
jgi:hypothetical protein